MTFGLDYLLWGLKPVGYHLSNLLLHAANAAVFYSVARWILGLALPGSGERGHVGLAFAAAFAALLFAIHPLRVESVAWATERRDVLSGLFYLSAILIYLRGCERGERGRGWYWLSMAVFVLALLSKSMVVNLPIVLLILDVYPLRRLGGAVGWWSAPARRVYVEKIPFVLLAAVASAVALMAQLSHDTMVSVVQLGDLGRRRLVVLLAKLEEVEDRDAGNLAAYRHCLMCRRRVGSSHLEPGQGLAGLREALGPYACD